MTVDPGMAVDSGIEVSVDNDGIVVEVTIDPAVCRTMSSADLGAEIVHAHRRARAAMIDRQRQAIRDALAEWGIDESAGTWTA